VNTLSCEPVYTGKDEGDFAIFGSEMATAKIKTAKGFPVEIFSPFAKKYYLPFGRLDRRNGYRT